MRAPSAGVVRFEDGGLGGKAAYVTQPDGTTVDVRLDENYDVVVIEGDAEDAGDGE